jgi:dTDP-4-amino-4,6-dideoxygalactose transaminase
MVALGAIGLEPGDEVIVSPWTMSASATSILVWNAIPVFADIEEKTFNIDIKSVEKNISKYTKAIMAIDMFGRSCDIKSIMKLAKKYNLKVITDSAQSPGAMHNGQYAGTHSDIGGYSLNYHKHIHTGEGGVIVTNDDGLAERMRLIRNHGEAVVGDKGEENINNIIGYNFRMGEIEAAIGIEQLKKLPNLINKKQSFARRLNEGFKDLIGLNLPISTKDSLNVYYVYGMSLDLDLLPVSREEIHAALVAEGLIIGKTFQNVHLMPIYQKKIAYGSSGFPWSSEICKREVSYDKGICPIAEKMQDECFLAIGLCNFDFDESDIDLIIGAFQKVWKNLDKLK